MVEGLGRYSNNCRDFQGFVPRWIAEVETLEHIYMDYSEILGK